MTIQNKILTQRSKLERERATYADNDQPIPIRTIEKFSSKITCFFAYSLKMIFITCNFGIKTTTIK